MPMKLLPISKGKFTMVDDEDFEHLKNQRWSFSNGYVAGWDKSDRKVKRLHRMLLKAPVGSCVDHIDGDPLNNQRCNLRFCAQNLNNANAVKRRTDMSSRFKGVSRSWHGNWKSYIKVDGKYIHGGMWETEREAAIAYDIMALKYFGDFARPNFPRIDHFERRQVEMVMGNPKKRKGASQFVGVCWSPAWGKFQAYVNSGGKRIWWKCFDTEDKAVKAREQFISENRIKAKRNHS